MAHFLVPTPGSRLSGVHGVSLGTASALKHFTDFIGKMQHSVNKMSMKINCSLSEKESRHCYCTSDDLCKNSRSVKVGEGKERRLGGGDPRSVTSLGVGRAAGGTGCRWTHRFRCPDGSPGLRALVPLSTRWGCVGGRECGGVWSLCPVLLSLVLQ